MSWLAFWAVSFSCFPAFAHAGENVTDEYQSTLSSIRAQDPSIDRHRSSDFTIIFVPGIATDLTRVMGEATGDRASRRAQDFSRRLISRWIG